MTQRGYSKARRAPTNKCPGATLLAVISLMVPGCSRNNVAIVPPPMAGKQVSPQGLSSFKILTETSKGTKPDGSNYQEVVPPRPIGELKAPDYPAKALKARLGGASVTVRICLDAAGQVSEIKDGLIGASSGGRFTSDFRLAVEEAVRRWKFQPAEYREYEDGKDLNGDGKPDYMVVIARKQVPVYFDVRFDFSIVRGEGRVQTK